MQDTNLMAKVLDRSVKKKQLVVNKPDAEFT